MVSLDIKDYEPPNPFEHAANALDDLAFIARWPKKMREARLTVVKVLRALRDMDGWEATLIEAQYHSPTSAVPSHDDLSEKWRMIIDAVLKDAPPEMLE